MVGVVLAGVVEAIVDVVFVSAAGLDGVATAIFPGVDVIVVLVVVGVPAFANVGLAGVVLAVVGCRFGGF